jgi:hypothetical protein
MVDIKYTHRLICDSDFLHWLSKQQDKEELLKQLMYIKSTSVFWKHQNNLILSSESKNCSTNKNINEKYLGAAFKKIEDPIFLLQYREQLTKNIIFAINIANDPPYKCYLLTSPENEKTYQESPHLKDMVSVAVISGVSARKIINNFFKLFIYEREKERERCGIGKY